ncbi:hypothetical protein [Corallococcus llansteffanensis]|uniref:hypothetical protein n=1 Tax=Corallococcus llansteffanensis TaxID=2316731 RepID=UPI0011C38E44|nr:hypothetical protein [Corallococcus llansteffanensis]
MAKRMGVVLAVALLAACTDDGDNGTPDGGGGGGTTKSAGPGLGTSKDSPEGTTFTLPAGLTLESPTKTYAVENPVECDDKFKDEAEGNGNAVALCLIFNNTTGGPITLTLPPGLLFVSKDGDIQNGLLPQRVTIEVPAGPRYFVPLHLYCANEDRDTGGVGNSFALGPVVQYAAFKELYTLLEGKTLERKDSIPIQKAVTRLTNGEGLSDADRAALKAL